ncbi:MAG: SIR2 family protein [Acidimicrobiales bacterium]
MDIDPMISLAVSVHSSPRTFALLVGSGISRAAQIPTGWDVVVDLVRTVAVLTDGAEPDDPIAWYHERGGDPDYSRLLEQLASTPAARRDLLNAYFEPTAEEREQGIKVPTQAHRAIAKLVNSGHISVIITTNFDRLMEAAIREAGIEPVVISSAAAAIGAMPLAHARCTLIKLHGDYLDPDIKNTVAELGAYDPSTEALLDRVLDEYGLVICGWSGVWDEALRNALLRTVTRRYATYWMRVGVLDDRARQLVEHRGAIDLAIGGADEFFEELEAKIAALAEMTGAQPLSVAIAVTELKRYLPDPVHRIRLHDLLFNEVRRFLDLPVIDANAPQPDAENVSVRMRHYEGGVGILIPLVATMAFLADRDEHDNLLAEVVGRLARRQINHSGFNLWLNLELYPAMLSLYALAVGAVARGRVHPLAHTLANVTVPHPNGDQGAASALCSWAVLDADVCNALVATPNTRNRTPVSDYLHRVLGPLAEDVVRPVEFDDVFDDVEYLLGVTCSAIDGRAPLGRFVWRQRSDGRSVSDVIDRFGGKLVVAGAVESEEALTAARSSYQGDVQSSRFRW